MTLPKKPKRRWGHIEIIRMIEMREVHRMKWVDIDRALDRPAGGAAVKYESMRLGTAPSGKSNETGGRILLSVEQEAERQMRLAARLRQGDISRLLGEPPPGFSALDRKNAGADA